MIKSISSIRRWPRLGKIRIGIKAISSGGKEYPKAVDYFVCPEEVRKIYGDQPKELYIMLPSNNPEDFFPQFFKKYGKSTGLVCKGDGITAIRSDAKGEMSEVECQGDKCSDYQKKQCKEIAMLQFFIPDVLGIGIWQIDTSSFNSIVNINSMIELLQMGNHNRLTGIPLVLKLIERDAKVEGKKKVIRILDIQIRKSMNDLKEIGSVINRMGVDIPIHTKLIENNAAPEIEKQEEDPFLLEMKKETEKNCSRAGAIEGIDILGKIKNSKNKDIDSKTTLEFKERELFESTVKKAKVHITNEEILNIIGNCGYNNIDEVAPNHRIKILEELRKKYLNNKHAKENKQTSLLDT